MGARLGREHARKSASMLSVAAFDYGHGSRSWLAMLHPYIGRYSISSQSAKIEYLRL